MTCRTSSCSPATGSGDTELLSKSATSATVIALTDIEVMVMSYPEFIALFDAVASFRRRLVTALAARAGAASPAQPSPLHQLPVPNPRPRPDEPKDDEPIRHARSPRGSTYIRLTLMNHDRSERVL